MRIKNRKVIIISSVIFAILLIILFTAKSKENKELYKTFGIQLSKNSKVVYNKSLFGALGDGESLVIYKVSPEDMQAIIEQYSVEDWLRLPFSKEIYDKLYKKIGLDSEEIKEYLDLDIEEGYYSIIDRFESSNSQIKTREKIDHFKFQNFTLGIIDTKENKLYLYSCNQ